MRKLVTVMVLVLAVMSVGGLSYADDANSLNETTSFKNLQSGQRNISTGLVNVMDGTSTEMAKAKNPGEQVTGFIAGTAIATQKTVHQFGAGVIDVLTFWIPKKEPLIKEKA